MAHIITLLEDRIVAALTAALITNIPEDDPTRAHLVKAGRFQENPLQTPVWAIVTGGDPGDDRYIDGIQSLERQDHNVGVEFPIWEIGGDEPTASYWRRGTVNWGICMVVSQESENMARTYARLLQGRIERTIPRVGIADLRDEFGEHAVKLFNAGSQGQASGGPPNSYLWRGKVFWWALTERTVG